MYGYIYLTTNRVNGKRYIGRKTATKWLFSWHEGLNLTAMS